jgi:hypothetical protein
MYSPTQNWSWLFYPPPYNFLAPPMTPVSASSPESTVQSMGLGSACNGLGCASCGGTCGQTGVGQTDAGGLFGSGLFLSADPTQWGWGEWAVLGLGTWAAVSMVSDLGRAGSAAYAPIKRARSRSKKRAALQADLDSL